MSSFRKTNNMKKGVRFSSQVVAYSVFGYLGLAFALVVIGLNVVMYNKLSESLPAGDAQNFTKNQDSVLAATVLLESLAAILALVGAILGTVIFTRKIRTPSPAATFSLLSKLDASSAMLFIFAVFSFLFMLSSSIMLYDQAIKSTESQEVKDTISKNTVGVRVAISLLSVFASIFGIVGGSLSVASTNTLFASSLSSTYMRGGF